MSRRAALWALAYAHSEPTRAPEELLAHLGPVAAWRARGRVERALARADAALGAQARADRGHRLRLACLFAAGRAPAGDRARDHGVVWAAFTALDPARLLASPPGARRGLTLLVTLGVLGLAIVALAVGGGVALYRSLQPPPRPHFTPVPPPPPRPLDERIGEAMTDWMIALDGLSATPGGPVSRRELREARAALDREVALLDPSVARAMGELLSEGERLVGSLGLLEDDEAALAAHVKNLNAACDVAGLHYYVDGVLSQELDPVRRRVYLSLFVVERARRWTTDPAPIRAVRVRRLDRVGFWKALVGYTSPEIPEAVVLLDQADEELLSRLLPVLAPSATFPLVDPEGDSAAAPWRGEAEAATAAALRAELAAVPGLDPAAATALGEVLHAQVVLVDSWQAQLEEQQSGLHMPWRYELDARELEWLRDKVRDYAELAPLQARLGEARLRGAWETLGAAFLESIERHEVQHRWDFTHLQPHDTAAAFARAGVPRALGPDGRALEDRAAGELSAYLAQMAAAPLPRAPLALLAGMLLDDRDWVSAEARAAAVLFPALERALGVPPGPPLVERGQVRPEAVVASLRGLLARPPEELRAAARTAWERLQRRPLPALSPP